MRTIEQVNFKDKKVIIRVDFNVPMKDGKITDLNRIEGAMPTIQKVISDGGKVILMSHLGKIKTEEDKVKNTLLPVAEKLSELMDKKVTFINETKGEKLETAINNLQNGEILLMENTRFEQGETKNEVELGKYWASLGEVFINDAFGTAHRAHASNVGIGSILPTYAGYLLEKEITFLEKAVDEPKRPMVAILGGAKVSDKIGVIENLISKADHILIGGGMMFTFLKAQGYNIGKSLVEDDKIELAKQLLAKANGKIVLPVDTVVCEEFSNELPIEELAISEIKDNVMGLDVGQKTVENFANIIKDAKTVVWNGPMGVFEMSNFAKGTIGVCESIAQNKEAITVIGGGDSAAAAAQLGYAKDFTHISTGGGASLEYLEGKTLPGVAIVK